MKNILKRAGIIVRRAAARIAFLSAQPDQIPVRHLQNSRRKTFRTIPLIISVNLLNYLCVNVFTFCFFL
jgi:hypothetical protein